MKFGSILRELRQAHGLTQEELAEKINLSKANVSKYEAGLVEPNLETLTLLASLFDVSINYLLGVPNRADSSQEHLTEKQKTALQIAEQLSDEQMKKVIDYADLIVKAGNNGN